MPSRWFVDLHEGDDNILDSCRPWQNPTIHEKKEGPVPEREKWSVSSSSLLPATICSMSATWRWVCCDDVEPNDARDIRTTSLTSRLSAERIIITTADRKQRADSVGEDDVSRLTTTATLSTYLLTQRRFLIAIALYPLNDIATCYDYFPTMMRARQMRRCST